MQPIRRRKKRPNYGVRTVEVCRSENGFGFTISGQQPCILSCIVPNSPAEKAGLRPGDYLIAVCGQNVSKVSHDDVVQLIGSCYGVLKLQIAENYYSDSSEEDFITAVRQKPKYHKYKNNTPNHLSVFSKMSDSRDMYCNNSIGHSNAMNSSNANGKLTENKDHDVRNMNFVESNYLLRNVVGYLGTIEMPKKLTPVSRLQIVRGCIKRLRSEKRNHIAILMTIFPCSLRLKNENGTTVAVYPGGRVTFCSANSEQDRKYFGIVTTSLEEEPSNSCHVFLMLSSKHEEHAKESTKFQINCTENDNSSPAGYCKEFPESCDAIISAVRKYYENNADNYSVSEEQQQVHADSPLPSNDSTTTSNSDSGIGFRDDSGHQSDRILVVDIQNQRLHIQAAGDSNLQYIDCGNEHASVRSDDVTNSFLSPSAREISFPPYLVEDEKKRSSEVSRKDDDGSCRLGKDSVFYSSEKCNDASYCHTNANNDGNSVLPQSRTCIEAADDYDFKSSNSETLLLDRLNKPRRTSVHDNYSISHSLENLKSRNDESNDIEVSENITRKHSLQDVTAFLKTDDNNKENSFQESLSNGDDKKAEHTTSANNWTISLEKLLHDSIGIHVFAEFLRKEYSVENVYFWAACERYQLLSNVEERKSFAYNIYTKYLGNDATDPVNVDSFCQQSIHLHLNNAHSSLFHNAQKQIFNLMKFDCYPRFLKSNLYKNCLLNTLNEDTLSAMNIKLDPELIITHSLPKVINSNNQDDVDKQCRGSRRRRSLMPWSRSRCKSRDRSNNDNISTSSSSLSSWDLTLPVTLCRVIFPDNSTAITSVHGEQTVRSLIFKLLEKRSFHYSTFQVTSSLDDKIINLEDSPSVLSGKEVKVEWRVEFILDLPNRKSLVIKSKPSHSLAAVLSPILIKHGYNLQMVTLCLISENEVIEPTMLVSIVDRKRVQVLTRSTPTPHIQGWNYTDCTADMKCVNLDEITNRVFEELLQGKADNFRSSNIPEKNPSSSVHSEEWGSEHSSGLLGRFLRRDSIFQDKSRRSKKCSDTMNTISEKKSIKKLPPIITKWNPVIKSTEGYFEQSLFEDLKRAQKGRLDDQRGTEINIELPDFLKDKENIPCNRKKLRKIRKDCASEEPKNPKDVTVNGDRSEFFDTNGGTTVPNNMNNVLDEGNSATNKTTLVEGHGMETELLKSSFTNDSRSNSRINGSDFVEPTTNKLGSSDNKNITSSSDKIAVNSISSVCKLLPNDNEPPPLPPKPKNIVPCSWRMSNDMFCPKSVYLDQPTSSFV